MNALHHIIFILENYLKRGMIKHTSFQIWIQETQASFISPQKDLQKDLQNLKSSFFLKWNLRANEGNLRLQS